MNPCWETLFIFTGKGYAHQRVSPVNGIQIVEYFSAGCFVLNEENECSALVDMFICHIGESLKVVFPGWTGWFFLDTPVNKLVVPSFRVRGPDKFHDGINGFPGRCFAENKKSFSRKGCSRMAPSGRQGVSGFMSFSDSGSDSGAISVETGRSQQIPFPKADAMASPLFKRRLFTPCA